VGYSKQIFFRTPEVQDFKLRLFDSTKVMVQNIHDHSTNWCSTFMHQLQSSYIVHGPTFIH